MQFVTRGRVIAISTIENAFIAVVYPDASNEVEGQIPVFPSACSPMEEFTEGRDISIEQRRSLKIQALEIREKVRPKTYTFATIDGMLNFVKEQLESDKDLSDLTGRG